VFPTRIFLFQLSSHYFVARLGFLMYFGACYGACIIFPSTLTTSHLSVHVPKHLIIFFLVGILERTSKFWPSESTQVTPLWDVISHLSCGTIQACRFCMVGGLPWP
jgi:hypothetical protein